MPAVDWVPNMGILKREGFTHRIAGESVNKATYKGFMNSDKVEYATRLFCVWDAGQTIQVAHKQNGQSAREWKFVGYGYFTDEEHFLKLLNRDKRPTPLSLTDEAQENKGKNPRGGG